MGTLTTDESSPARTSSCSRCPARSPRRAPRRTCRATTSSRRRSRHTASTRSCASRSTTRSSCRSGRRTRTRENITAPARRQRRVHREDGHARRQERPRLRQALVALLDAGARRRHREDVHRAGEGRRPVRGLRRRHDAQLPRPDAKPPDQVAIFTREGCPYCAKAKKLLTSSATTMRRFRWHTTRSKVVGAITGEDGAAGVRQRRADRRLGEAREVAGSRARAERLVRHLLSGRARQAVVTL